MSLSVAPLFSSSSGNCTYIATERSEILVDAGMAGKYIESALKQIGKRAGDIGGILVTHEHTDHIRGVGVLSRRYGIPVYANAGTWAAMEAKLGEIPQALIRVVDGEEFFVGDICVHPIPISHDAAAPVGYALMGGGRKVSVLTDTGHITKAMRDASQGSAIVLLESNHDVDMLNCGRYPFRLKTRIHSGTGHLSNEDAGRAAAELARRGVRGILLGHLSRENNFEELAYKTVLDALAMENIAVGRDMALATTKKDAVTGYYTLK